MYTKQTIIKNISGLHARPASEFVALAKTFESKITIKKLETENAVAANAKSIIKVLAQGISVNTTRWKLAQKDRMKQKQLIKSLSSSTPSLERINPRI